MLNKLGRTYLAMLVLTLVLVTACGQNVRRTKSILSSPEEAVESTSDAISGVAATGKAFRGTVYIKGSAGETNETTTNTSGEYSVSVDGLTAPYLLMINTGTQVYLSAATSSDVGATVNVTPLTHVVVSNVMENSNGSEVFNSFNESTYNEKVTSTNLNTEEENLAVRIQPTLEAFDADDVDILNDAFTANGAGIDAVLDVHAVDSSTDGTTVVLTNVVEGGTLTITTDGSSADVEAGDFDPTEPSETYNTYLDDLDDIESAIRILSSYLATGNGDIEDLLTTDFLHFGADITTSTNISEDLATVLLDGDTTDSTISINNVSFVTYSSTAGVISFSIIKNEILTAYKTMPVKKVGSYWYFYGNQAPINLKLGFLLERKSELTEGGATTTSNSITLQASSDDSLADYDLLAVVSDVGATTLINDMDLSGNEFSNSALSQAQVESLELFDKYTVTLTLTDTSTVSWDEYLKAPVATYDGATLSDIGNSEIPLLGTTAGEMCDTSASETFIWSNPGTLMQKSITYTRGDLQVEESLEVDALTSGAITASSSVTSTYAATLTLESFNSSNHTYHRVLKCNYVPAVPLTAVVTEPTLITLTMDKALSGSAGDTTAFTVSGAANSPTVTDVTISSTSIALTLSANIIGGETITLSYAASGTDDLTSIHGDVANFTNLAVSNGSLVDLTNVGVDVAAGNITLTTTEMEYSLDSTNGTDGTWAAASDTNTAVTFVAGDVYVRDATDTSNYRLVATIAAAAAAPAYTIDYTNETTAESIPTTVEYNTDNDFSTANTDGAGATINLTPGTDVYFRVKATTSALPSNVQTLTVSARPTTPSHTIDYSAETTGEVVPTTVEYNTDNNFSTANTDGTGAAIALTPGTDVYFRVKPSGSNFASEVQSLVVASRPATPSAPTINYVTETATAIASTIEYDTDNAFPAPTSGDGATPISLTPGTDLYFRVSATASTFASAAQTLVVAARPATPAHTIDYTNETTGEVVPTTVEYNTDNNFSTANSDGTGVVLSLTPGTDLYLRVKPTGSSFASDVQTLVVASKPATPTHTIDYSAETTGEAVPTTVEYNTDNNFVTANTDGTGATVSLTPGTDIYFRVKASGSNFASEVQTLVVAARPAAPSVPTIDYSGETASAVASTIEYDTDNAFPAATSGDGVTPISLTPGTDLYFRVAATGSSFASTSQTLVVAARGVAPSHTVDYTNETTGEAVPSTVEYNTDNNFSTANTDGTGAFISLTPGTDVYLRTKATGSAFASEVQALVVAGKPATPTHTIDYTNETTGEVVPSTVEYNTDNNFSTANIDGTDATISLTPGTDVYFRVKATASNFASDVQTLVVAARPATPTHTIDYTNETTGEVVPSTVEYNTDNNFSTANTDGAGSAVSLTPGTDMYFRVKPTGSAFASDAQTLVVAARGAAPSHTIDYTNEVTGEVVPTTVEYNTDNNFSTANTDGAGSAISLTPGTDVYFRAKATGSAFASDVQTLVVAARPAAPAHTVDYSFETTGEVVPATVEYNTDNNFSTANTDGTGALVNLTPGTDVYFRAKATGSAFASDVQTLVVAARPSAPSHTVDYTNETTGEIVSVTEEYNTDNNFSTANTDGASAAISLTPGTNVYFRVKSTGSSFASDVHTLVVSSRPSPPLAPTIDYAAETASAVASTIEYDSNNSFPAPTSGDGVTPVSLTPGTDLYFRYIATGSDFASDSQILTVNSRPATPTHTVDYTNETTTLGVATTEEYNTDNNFSTANTDGTGSQIGLTPGTDVYIRVKSTGSTFASEVQTLTVAARPATPTHTIDYTNEVTGEVVPATVEYNTDNNFATANTDGAGSTIALTPGTDVYFRVKATASSFVSEVQTLLVAARPAAPTHTIDYINEVTGEVVPTTVEYNTDNNFTTANTDGTGATISLTPGTDVYFRAKATGSAFASNVQSLVVAARPAAPTHTIDYTNEQTGEVVPSTVEYNTDNNFTTANTDGTGVAISLTPGTDVYFRAKATGSAFASNVQTLVVAARPAIGYVVTVDNDASVTAAILTDGTAVLAAEGLEYNLDSAGYVSCVDSQTVDLSGSSTLFVRKAATGSSFASLPTSDLDGT